MKSGIPWRNDRSVRISLDDNFRDSYVAVCGAGEKRVLLYRHSKENYLFIFDSHMGWTTWS